MHVAVDVERAAARPARSRGSRRARPAPTRIRSMRSSDAIDVGEVAGSSRSERGRERTSMSRSRSTSCCMRQRELGAEQAAAPLAEQRACGHRRGVRGHRPVDALDDARCRAARRSARRSASVVVGPLAPSSRAALAERVRRARSARRSSRTRCRSGAAGTSARAPGRACSRPSSRRPRARSTIAPSSTSRS